MISHSLAKSKAVASIFDIFSIDFEVFLARKIIQKSRCLSIAIDEGKKERFVRQKSRILSGGII